MFVSARSFVAFVFVLAACAGASAQSLAPAARAGGQVSQPVAVGDFLYVPAGVGIDVWNLADPAHPEHVGDTLPADEAPGPIYDLTAVAGHLYATAFTDGYRVFVWSLDDPAHPALIGPVDGAFGERVGTDGEHLFAAGSAIGLASYDLADPAHPALLGNADGVLGYVMRFTVTGDRAVLETVNGFGDRTDWLVDLADPAHPQATSTATICVYECPFEQNYVFSIGAAGFAVFDASDPLMPELVFRDTGTTSLPVHGAIDDDTLWLFGDRIEAWDVGSPASPVRLGSATNDLSFMTHVAVTPHGVYGIDTSGGGLLVDASTPATPTVLAHIDVPGSGQVAGAFLDAQHAYLADDTFGLRITTPELGAVGSLAIGGLETRAAWDVAVADGIAYVSGAGSLYAIDVSDAEHPALLGSVATGPFFLRVVVDGNHAYLSAYNQATTFMIVDITDPLHMQAKGTLEIDYPHDLVVRGRHVYTASELGLDARGGVRVIDVSNPDAPIQVGVDESCGDSGLGASVAFIDNASDTLAIGCDDGSVYLVDASDPEALAPIGHFRLPDAFNPVNSLAAARRHLYVANDFGIDEYDVADPSSPERIARYATPMPVMAVRSAADALIGVSLFAGTYSYAMTGAASAPPHSHHTRPARPSFEP